MAKYLYQVSYTAEGLQGLLKEGGSKRLEAARQLMGSVGASVESLHFALGDSDAYIIIDAPDNTTAAAASLAASASGAVAVKTIALLSPEEIDEATRQTVEYRSPGQ